MKASIHWDTCLVRHFSKHKCFENSVIILSHSVSHLNMSCLMTKPTKWLLPVKTQIIWPESLLCTQWVAKDPSFLHVDSKDWSDWADAQADLSLRWAHMPFCWFCREAAHLMKNYRNNWPLLRMVKFLWDIALQKTQRLVNNILSTRHLLPDRTLSHVA